jgi:hypothetical protein
MGMAHVKRRYRRNRGRLRTLFHRSSMWLAPGRLRSTARPSADPSPDAFADSASRPLWARPLGPGSVAFRQDRTVLAAMPSTAPSREFVRCCLLLLSRVASPCLVMPQEVRAQRLSPVAGEPHDREPHVGATHHRRHGPRLRPEHLDRFEPLQAQDR